MYEDFEPPPPPSRMQVARRHARDIGGWAGEVAVRFLFLTLMASIIASILSQK